MPTIKEKFKQCFGIFSEKVILEILMTIKKFIVKLKIKIKLKMKFCFDRVKNILNWRLIFFTLIFGALFFLFDIVFFAFWYLNTDCICNNDKVISSIPEMLYFSLITFTTTGYGDLLPTCHFAKLIIGMQCITSYLFTPIYCGFIFKAVIERPKNVKIMNTDISLSLKDNIIGIINFGNPLKNNKLILQILNEKKIELLKLSKETEILDDYWELYFFEIEDELKRCKVDKNDIFYVKLLYSGNDIETNQLVFVSKTLKLLDIKF